MSESLPGILVFVLPGTMQLAGGLSAGLVFGGGAWYLRLLTKGGALAAGLLAACVVALGGWPWVVPSLGFFVSSCVLTRHGRSRKAALEASALDRSSTRNAGQVLANGGIAWVLLLVHAAHPAEGLYAGFVGAFAAAAADTWATEVGTLVPGWPWHLRTGCRVPPGTSGAVSPGGTLAALGGALTVGLLAVPFLSEGALIEGGVVVGGGFLGACADSLAGATVQAQYRHPQTGGGSEHPSPAHVLVRGQSWVTGDAVNGFCTLVGAITGFLGSALV